MKGWVQNWGQGFGPLSYMAETGSPAIGRASRGRSPGRICVGATGHTQNNIQNDPDAELSPLLRLYKNFYVKPTEKPLNSNKWKFTFSQTEKAPLPQDALQPKPTGVKETSRACKVLG